MSFTSPRFPPLWRGWPSTRHVPCFVCYTVYWYGTQWPSNPPHIYTLNTLPHPQPTNTPTGRPIRLRAHRRPRPPPGAQGGRAGVYWVAYHHIADHNPPSLPTYAHSPQNDQPINHTHTHTEIPPPRARLPRPPAPTPPLQPRPALYHSLHRPRLGPGRVQDQATARPSGPQPALRPLLPHHGHCKPPRPHRPDSNCLGGAEGHAGRVPRGGRGGGGPAADAWPAPAVGGK